MLSTAVGLVSFLSVPSQLLSGYLRGGCQNGSIWLLQSQVHPITPVILVRFTSAVCSRNDKILDTIDLDTQPYERETTGMWIDIPEPTLEFMISKRIIVAEGIHAAQHAVLNCFPMARDVKTECKAPEKEYKAKESQRKRPARYVSESHI